MDGGDSGETQSKATLAGWPQRLAHEAESATHGNSTSPSANVSQGIAGAHHEDYSAALASAEASRRASLPRLYRQKQQDTTASESPSVAERLSRMRLEDRRRMRNAQLRESKLQNNTSKLRGDAPTFQPYTSMSSASSSSASARAGALFFAANQLSQRDKVDAQRDRALRRKFAGPVPPTSWRSGDERGARSKDEKGTSAVSPPDALNAFSHIDRWRALRVARQFFADGRGRGESMVREDLPSATPSLVDLSLCTILVHLGDNEGKGAHHSAMRGQVYALPVHLKERALALAGRLAMTAPLSSSAIWNLLARDDGKETGEQARDASSEELEDDEEGDELNDLPDTWDAESDKPVVPTRSAHAACVNVDLSFAAVSGIFLRSLVKNANLHAGSIRSLSLAGWGNGPDATEGRARKCLRTSASLLSVLDQLPNLQVLSLACTRLLPDQEAEEHNHEDEEANSIRQHTLNADTASEAMAFLRKLSRRTARLVALDLSACRWIDGAVIANAGWYSTSVPVRRLAWPYLQHLVLTDCPAFAVAAAGDSVVPPTLRESGNFAASWHAAHHGSPRVTSSPYFLAHKPGLGRALLAHGVGAWDYVSGRGSLIEREAAALARHSGLQLHDRAARVPTAPRSAFDDEAGFGVREAMNGAPAPFVGSGGGGGYAISHGIAPFAGRRAARSGASPSSAREPPRCPVSKEKVAAHEWNRARVLDAVRGRWGSAILGTFVQHDDRADSERITRSDTSVGSGGAFVTVYF